MYRPSLRSRQAAESRKKAETERKKVKSSEPRAWTHAHAAHSSACGAQDDMRPSALQRRVHGQTCGTCGGSGEHSDQASNSRQLIARRRISRSRRFPHSLPPLIVASLPCARCLAPQAK